jgi:hypothetical protein
MNQGIGQTQGVPPLDIGAFSDGYSEGFNIGSPLN